ncbi:hypothetical protein DLAC_03103 [Tieghemostelium lacteum]|uniref:Branchpoint-bridging protein n=1 Tax=Tieghemostelium lacteum TaxID=361077 RepID=A0A152A2L5_TIELA|nr:hypothetical protein DLAC_03103 [Tieghemostelium lacteum]|eukprot:KYR00357.1 hypothetical protein DLAC_03103 [Tieghemostelium lacteum]
MTYQFNELPEQFNNEAEDNFFKEMKEIGRGRSRTRDEISKIKRTKLTYFDEKVNVSPFSSIPRVIPPGLNDQQISALILRIRIEEITKKLLSGVFEITDRDRERSPSPPPIYDNNTGKRTNTREQRIKEKVMKERHQLILAAQQISTSYKPPSDYQPPVEKKTCKIYIPIKDHPEYNFIGLIIGPRGNTQKKLEKESGAKIAIRGKGSSREGKSTKPQYQENDELHVLLTADTQEQLDKASILVREFLVPVEEGKNEHKRQQLRELAEMNGTLRERPAYIARSWERADIKCVHCGESSHPSSDCPLRNNNDQQMLSIIEEEYKKCISEVKEILGYDFELNLNDNNNSNNSSNNNMANGYDEFREALDKDEQLQQQQYQQQYYNNNSNNNYMQNNNYNQQTNNNFNQYQNWNQNNNNDGNFNNNSPYGPSNPSHQQSNIYNQNFNTSPYGPSR